MIETNWNALIQTATEGFDPVPPDEYEVEITKSEYKPTTGGKPMYIVTFNITSGPYTNRKVFNNFVVSAENPNAMGYFFQHMAALGLPREWFASQPSHEQIATALLGRSAVISVTTGEYQGKPKNNVGNIKAPGSGGAASSPFAPQQQASSQLPQSAPGQPAPPNVPVQQPAPPAQAEAPAPAQTPAATPEAPAQAAAPPATAPANGLPEGIDPAQFAAFMAQQQQPAAAPAPAQAAAPAAMPPGAAGQSPPTEPF